MLTAARSVGTGWRASAWAPMTTCPSRSTSPSWSPASRRWPGAPAPRRAAGLGFGDLTMDPGRRVVTRAGRKLALTPKEFAVLECLLAADGRPVPAEELLRPGVGRGRRPVHHHREDHHRPAAGQARRPAGDRDRPRQRLPHRRIMMAIPVARSAARALAAAAAPHRPAAADRPVRRAVPRLRRGPARRQLRACRAGHRARGEGQRKRPSPRYRFLPASSRSTGAAKLSPLARFPC